MIIYRHGDVVKAFQNDEINVLVHGVNCQGKMNSGIAKQIRAEYPEVFEAYDFYCTANNSTRDHEGNVDTSILLGEIQEVRVDRPAIRFIVNAFTQDNYGYEGDKYCSYDAIDRVMRQLKRDGGGATIGMPKIGAGLGGGDWQVIEAIINSHFHDRDIYVYTLDELPKSSGKNDLA